MDIFTYSSHVIDMPANAVPADCIPANCIPTDRVPADCVPAHSIPADVFQPTLPKSIPSSPVESIWLGIMPWLAFRWMCH